ncbi:MAG: RHS repeat-associated core domain-containing protein, partial [Bacteroidota bacterium]
TQYFDSLGRVFMIEDDNGLDNLSNPLKYRVRNTLDITGRVIAVTDALNRVMTHHVYGLKQQLYTTNIDSGERWMLADVAGKPIYAVNSRGFTFRNTYDALQRPLEIYVTPPAQSEILAEEYVYGTDDAVYNIGRVEFLKDQSGQTHFIEYDFKGNPLETLKTFCEDYNRDIDWSQSPVLQTETFTQFMEYDAMNRPTLLTQPDGSIIEYAYNKAALPEAIAVTHLGQGTPVDYVTNINYNEKGQRTRVYYGNGTRTRYYYDDKTFRLNRLKTTRNSGADVLLDLNYIYDAVGNIVEINDNAAQTFYYDNSVIAPQQQFWYDPLYRLVKATGRELVSLAMPGHSDFANNIPLPNPGNSAMQNYTEYFTFDALGNITNLDHYTSGQTPNWTREYYYNSNNNYLLSHIQNQTPPNYTYDDHGNMLTMPHLSALECDFKDRLVKTTRGTESTYYRYNSSGERSRKITEKQNGTFVERLYLGGYEVYREYASNWDIDFERQTLCINDIKVPEASQKSDSEENNEKGKEEQKKFGFDQNKKIAIIETKTIESGDPVSPLEIAIRYQYSNHLGSSCLELDESADIISYEEYHPFGTTSYRAGRTETEVSLKRYKYVGKERDEESGLYYYGARYYADWLCRFISVDPMAHKFPQWSPYCAFGDDPIGNIDPDGMYFFGLFGSTSSQRQAAAQLALATGGTVLNRHSRSICVSYTAQVSTNQRTGDAVMAIYDQYFNKDGSLVPLNHDWRQFDDNALVSAEMWLNSKSSNIPESAVKIAANMLYSFPNSVSILLRGKTIAGSDAAEQKVDAFVDVAPSLVGLIEAGVSVRVSKSALEGFNQFIKKYPGLLKGRSREQMMKEAGKLFQINKELRSAKETLNSVDELKEATEKTKKEVTK